MHIMMKKINNWREEMIKYCSDKIIKISSIIGIILLFVLTLISNNTTILSDYISIEHLDKIEIYYTTRKKVENSYPLVYSHTSHILKLTNYNDMKYLYNNLVGKENNKNISKFTSRLSISINDTINVVVCPKEWQICRIKGQDFVVEDNLFTVIVQLITKKKDHSPHL